MSKTFKEKGFDWGGYRYLWVLLGSLVLIVVTLGQVLWPRIELIISGIGEIRKGREELAFLVSKVAALEALSLRQLEDQADLLSLALPETSRPALALKTIQELSRQEGLKLESVKVNPGKIASESAKIASSKEEFPHVAYQVAVAGKDEGLIAFVNSLEKSLPLLRVEKVGWQVREEGSSVLIEVLGFYQFLPKEVNFEGKKVVELTSEEKVLLIDLRGYGFYQELLEKDLPAVGKTNPFI